MSAVGGAGHHDLFLAHNAGRRVPTGANWFCVIKFNHLPVIDIRPEGPLDCINIATQCIARNLDSVV